MDKWLTVITTCLNERDLIVSHVEHFLHLEKFGVASVLVDGGSVDGTFELVRSRKNSFINLVQEKSSIYEAFNIGLKFVTTPFVAFLGVGDKLRDDFLFEAKNIALAQEVDIIYGDLIYLDSHGLFLKRHSYRNLSFLSEKKDIKLFPFSHSGSIQNSSLFKENVFDPQYRIAGDYDWLCKSVLNKPLKLKKIELDQSIMLMGGLSTSVKSKGLLISEGNHIRKKYGISKSFKSLLLEFKFRFSKLI